MEGLRKKGSGKIQIRPTEGMDYRGGGGWGGGGVVDRDIVQN